MPLRIGLDLGRAGTIRSRSRRGAPGGARADVARRSARGSSSIRCRRRRSTRSGMSQARCGRRPRRWSRTSGIRARPSGCASTATARLSCSTARGLTCAVSGVTGDGVVSTPGRAVLQTHAGGLISCHERRGGLIVPTAGYTREPRPASTRKFLTLHAAELWVETLVAQDTMATIGGRILVGPTTTLTVDLPASGVGPGRTTYRRSTSSTTRCAIGDWSVFWRRPGSSRSVLMVASTRADRESRRIGYTSRAIKTAPACSDWYAGDAGLQYRADG